MSRNYVSAESEMSLDQWARPIVKPHYPEVQRSRFNLRVKVGPNEVSTMQKCQTSDATILCILEIDVKVTKYGEYNIGGTYTNKELDLWFYYTTSYCPQDKCLLSLFVCCRKVGSYDIGVSKSSEIGFLPLDYSSPYVCTRCYLTFNLEWQVFTSSQPDDKFFIKTYCIPAKLVHAYGAYDTLCIPIKIEDPQCLLNRDLVRSIKLKHNDIGDLISKEKTDLTVKSASGTQYQVHKIVFAAHSPVLRKLVVSGTEESLTLDISDQNMKLLLGYLYSGIVKDISSENSDDLKIIGTKFKLNNLMRLVQPIPVKIESHLRTESFAPTEYVLYNIFE